MIQKYEINELLDNLQDYLFPGLFSNKNIRKDDIVFDLCKMFKVLEVSNYKASQFVNDLDEIKKMLNKKAIIAILFFIFFFLWFKFIISIIRIRRECQFGTIQLHEVV